MIASPSARRAAARFVESQRAGLDRKEMQGNAEASVSSAFQMSIANDREALSTPVAADASPPSPCCVSASIEEPEAPAARKTEMVADPAPAYDAERARLEAVETMRLWHAERDTQLPDHSTRLAVVARAVTNLHGQGGAWDIEGEPDEGWDAMTNGKTPPPAAAKPMKLADEAVVTASLREAPSGDAARRSSDRARINSYNGTRITLVDLDADPSVGSSTTPLVGSTTYSDVTTADGLECVFGCFTSLTMGDLGDSDCVPDDDWIHPSARSWSSGAAAAAPSLPLPPRWTPPTEPKRGRGSRRVSSIGFGSQPPAEEPELSLPAWTPTPPVPDGQRRHRSNGDAAAGRDDRHAGDDGLGDFDDDGTYEEDDLSMSKKGGPPSCDSITDLNRMLGGWPHAMGEAQLVG